MKAPSEVQRLVENFGAHIEAYKSGAYNETQVRVEYVNPLFTALGWDVDNKSGFAPSYQDVKHEYSLKTADGAKAPDYCFCIGGTKKFFLETKKPSVYIKDDIGPAFQIRRYGWTGKLSLSILTDFEEFAVYDCRIKPRHNDKASVGRIEYFKYTEYLEKWDYLQNIFSKEAIQKGSFDSYITSDKKKKGTTTVDQSFLEDMEDWRDLLARNIALRNAKLTTKQLNHLVQATIDRIVFLRICEDREIEEYGRLQRILKDGGIYSGLCSFFKQADDKYNSGLFHFKDEKGRGQADALSLKLKIDDKTLTEIICKLYYPESPYVFSQIPAEILGQVYEKFLGKVIRLTPGHQAKVEFKPEVRKAGGVYYTPKYIVDYIVKNTVGELLKKKTPAQAKKLCILDPACGSGSFLIGTYQYLLDWYIAEYAKDAAKHKRLIHKDGKGEWQLSTAEKKEILLKNIHGVDIDRQAVEVTKLSLLLKVLENENKDSLQSQFQLFHERALPDLSNNIKCGNSLIGTDFFVGRNLELFERDEMEKINAFDWDSEQGFGEIMKAGGFDAVIGNPPYVFTRGEGFTEQEKSYYYQKYKHSSYQLNTYAMFVEEGFNILSRNSFFGFIIPNNWITISSMKILRDFLISQTNDLVVVNNLYKVFLGANVDTSIIIFKKSDPAKVHLKEANRPSSISSVRSVPYKVLLNEPLIRIGKYKETKTTSLLLKIESASIYLSEIVKVSTGLKAYQIGKGKPTQNKSIKLNRAFHSTVRKNKTYKKYLDGKDVKRYFLGWSGEYLSYGDFLAEPRKSVPFIGMRILVRQIPSKMPYAINAILTEEEYLNDINSMIIFSELNKGVPYRFLLGCINSKLTSTWFYHTFDKFQRGIFPQFKVNELAQFPIPKLDLSKPAQKAQHDRMVQLVDQILDTQKKLHASVSEQDRKHFQQKTDILDKQIDALVYELYDLAEEEIKIVEGTTG